MSLSNNYQPAKTSSNGVLVDFGFSWNGLNTEYIRVYIEDKDTGVVTLIESSEYTITSFNEAGGNVRFNSAPADNNFIIIAREINQIQETPYRTSLGFNGKNVESSFDKLTGIVQELSEKASRSPTMPIGTEIDANFPIPVPGNLIQGRQDGKGWEDSGVSAQGLVDDAQAAKDAAAASAASATASANSATASATSADEASESAEIAKDQFKGEWESDFPDMLGTGYSIGNTASFNANQWWSKIDNNTAVPPTEYNTPSAEWELFLRGAITNDEFVADVREARFLTDGIKTAFDLTAANPAFKPTNNNQIFGVFLDTDIISEEEYSISVNGSGHSIITFTSVYAASIDTAATYNLIVRGATPQIADYEDRIDTLETQVVTGVLHVRDEKTSGTDGGTSVSGIQTRTLNTTILNNITGASLSSNQFILPAGNYKIDMNTSAYQTGRTRCILYNITDAAIEYIGMSNLADSTQDGTANVLLNNYKFTLAESKTFELRQYCQEAESNVGLGVPSSMGEIEVYSEVFIEKIGG